MRELFESLRHTPYQSAHQLLLLDTCFIVSLAERSELHHLTHHPIATTSFNLEELEHIHHRLQKNTVHELRKFFKEHPDLTILDVPVHPGDREGERHFVESVDSSLLQKIPDASDAVLMATAVATQSNVLTKDKHHLFTTVLENYLHAYDIKVWKEWKDAI